jgi:hypothetical protein
VPSPGAQGPSWPAGSTAASSSPPESRSSRYSWQASQRSSSRTPAVTTRNSSSRPVTAAIAWLRLDRRVRASTRRRESSYMRAFSIAPATSDAVWTRNVRTPSSNSRGASVCSTTVPSAGPERAGMGTATIDWKRSSSSSGTYFMRGSAIACSRMNSGVPFRATHPASPSSRPNSTRPTRCAYTCEAARRRRRSPSRR